MPLLERESLITSLENSLAQAADGQGRTVLVSGEAGIGKTSLLESFVASHQSSVRLLWGACESLFIPRPLGPLYDIAPQMGAAFRDQLNRGELHRAALFLALIQDLQGNMTPNLFIIEDVHWADEATLDVIKFLGRRLHSLKILLVLTYRDDEPGPNHALRLVLGDLPSKAAVRIQIPPLSEAAVTALAKPTGYPARELYAITGGNPFFVTELLANTSLGIPSTVRDAVLARATRLSSSARSLLELVSVSPNYLNQWIVEAVLHPAPATLDECVTNGMLHMEKDGITFRHELARQAIESVLAPTRRQSLHMQVLRAWLAQEIDPKWYARVLHHAIQADDHEMIMRFAPLAARYAAAHGAHREAASHYASLLDHVQLESLEQRAAFLEQHSYECYLTGQMAVAEQSRREALACWVQAERPDKEGHNLRWLSRLNWFLGRSAEAEHYATQSVQVLETLPANAELAMAYSNLAQLRMLAENVVEAVHWGNRAISMAETFDDLVTVVHSLNNVGTAELNAGDERGRAKLERSLSLALELQLEEHVARAYSNLVSFAVTWHQYALAEHYLADGLAYSLEHEVDAWLIYLRTWKARLHFQQGDWDEAAHEAKNLLDNEHIAPVSKIAVLVVIGMVRVRRGDPGGWQSLAEADELAQQTRELQRIAPVAAARAEGAWLQNDYDQSHEAVQSAFALALTRHHAWTLGELAFWMWRAGALDEAPAGSAEPFARQIAGDWQSAADAWEKNGCPYERAMALADGNESSQRIALRIFEDLNARPAIELVRRRLRSQGVRQIPRGPRVTTQKNPLGLTNRQLEVLLLIVQGLPNAMIANRLSTSTKTIDHHVSAILAKIGVPTRAEAITTAYQLGLVVPENRDNMGKMTS